MNEMYNKSSLIIAHRGASYDAPENTLASFRLGLAQQADAIECDIHLSADNEVIVIHDPTLTRTTGLNKKVEELTLDNLKQLDAGSWKGPQFNGEPLPILKEVFEILPPDKKILIEIKSGTRTIEPIRRILELGIISHTQIILMEFDLETVIKLRAMYDSIEILWLYGFPHVTRSSQKRKKLREVINIAVRHKFDGVNIQNILELDDDYIRECHAHKLKCYCWTVNDPDRARYLIEYGIDGFATDKPGWIREQLKTTIKNER